MGQKFKRIVVWWTCTFCKEEGATSIDNERSMETVRRNITELPELWLWLDDVPWCAECDPRMSVATDSSEGG